MIADLDLPGLGEGEGVAPMDPLAEAIASRRALAAQGLRELQASSAALALALETGTASIEDILLADAAFAAAARRADGALKDFGSVLDCKGTA